MNKGIITALVFAAISAAAVQPARAEDAASDKAYDADKGADTIDVTKYPKAQQEKYKVFAEKCAKCHTLARPINSEYALPDEWTAYVEKMRHKKRSGIDEESQKIITDFLIFDSSMRKKALVAQKLKAKAAAEKVAPKDAAKSPKD